MFNPVAQKERESWKPKWEQLELYRAEISRTSANTEHQVIFFKHTRCCLPRLLTFTQRLHLWISRYLVRDECVLCALIRDECVLCAEGQKGYCAL